ncbi:MAG: PQQ-binding-like beta-propeller repeat protein [Methanomicrobiales archaeon]|nr:PQQ-binding-like beta-propeller repeat protein [Methanomicrobiales archaeon]
MNGARRRLAASAAAVLLAMLLLPAATTATWTSWSYTPVSEVSEVALSADGAAAFIGGDRIHCLNTAGGVEWKAWFGDHISATPDGKTIVCSLGGQIYWLDGDSGSPARDIEAGSPVRHLVITPDGSRTIVADAAGELTFYNAKGEEIRTVEPAEGTAIEDMALSRDGNYLGVISREGTWLYSKYGSTRWEREGQTDGEGGQCIDLSANGRYAAAGSDAGLRYFNSTGGIVWERPCGMRITAVAIAPTGNYVAAGSQNSILSFFAANGTLLWKYNVGAAAGDGTPGGPGITDLSPSRLDTVWILDLALSEDGEYVLAGSTDKAVRLFSRDGTLVWSRMADAWVNHVGIAKDGATGIAVTKSMVIGLVNEPEPEAAPPDVAAATLPMVPAAPIPGDPGNIPVIAPVPAAVPEIPQPTLRTILAGGSPGRLLQLLGFS